MTDIGHRSRLLAGLGLAVAVCLVTGAGLVIIGGADGDSPLGRAGAELSDDADFTRASDAGAAFVRASEHLSSGARRCGGGPRACPELATAAAFARVGAVALLRCGRPEVFRFRTEFRSYLDALSTDPDAPPPVAPAC